MGGQGESRHLKSEDMKKYHTQNLLTVYIALGNFTEITKSQCGL